MLSRNKPTTEHFRFNLGDYTGMRSQLQEIDWATALEGKSFTGNVGISIFSHRHSN